MDLSNVKVTTGYSWTAFQNIKVSTNGIIYTYYRKNVAKQTLKKNKKPYKVTSFWMQLTNPKEEKAIYATLVEHGMVKKEYPFQIVRSKDDTVTFNFTTLRYDKIYDFYFMATAENPGIHQDYGGLFYYQGATKRPPDFSELFDDDYDDFNRKKDDVPTRPGK